MSDIVVYKRYSVKELRLEQAAAIWHGMGEVGKALRKAVRKGKPVDPADPKDQGKGHQRGNDRAVRLDG